MSYLLFPLCFNSINSNPSSYVKQVFGYTPFTNAVETFGKAENVQTSQAWAPEI